MSTFLSSPLLSFLTLMLQASRVTKPARASTNATDKLVCCDLFMLRSSLGKLGLTLDARTALGDVRNADRQVSPDWDLAEQCFHRTQFRNRRIGKRTQIILDARKIRHHIRIAHSQHGGLLGRVLQKLVQQDPRGVRHGDRVLETARCWNYING